MKIVYGCLLTASLLVGGQTFLGAAAQAEGGSWVCKTGDIYNGRSSAPQFLHGRTRDEAYAKAVATCAHSGQIDYCNRAISCWAE